jgi:ASC-1-like (ASCH) protein
MKRHEVKCWVPMFERVKDGSKTFDVRNNDRDYQAGDIIVLKAFDPKKEVDTDKIDGYEQMSHYKREDAKTTLQYTGEELKFLIGYVFPLSQMPMMSYAVLEVMHRDRGANLVVLSLLPVPPLPC